MAKAPVIEEKQLRHMLKVASVAGESPLRDAALLYVAYGIGCMLTELASLTVADYLNEDGAVREESRVRAAIAQNSRERPLIWTNPRVVAARRTFTVRLHRKGYDVRHITDLLGLSTISATKRLIDSDPVRLADLVAGAV